MIYDFILVSDAHVFYREAGEKNQPVLVLLHGFPSSSHMFAGLMDRLREQYHVIAFDFPGFGQSDLPAREEFVYSLDHFEEIIVKCLERLNVKKCFLYGFDCGASVALRMLKRHKELVQGIIIQNQTIYEETLLNKDFMELEKEPDEETLSSFSKKYQPAALFARYAQGNRKFTAVSPDTYTLDIYYAQRRGFDEVQIDLARDEQNTYQDAGKYRKLLKDVPLLVFESDRDAQIDGERALELFQKDSAAARCVLLKDAGHYALEISLDTVCRELSAFIQEVMQRA